MVGGQGVTERMKSVFLDGCSYIGFRNWWGLGWVLVVDGCGCGVIGWGWWLLGGGGFVVGFVVYGPHNGGRKRGVLDGVGEGRLCNNS